MKSARPKGGGECGSLDRRFEVEWRSPVDAIEVERASGTPGRPRFFLALPSLPATLPSASMLSRLSLPSFLSPAAPLRLSPLACTRPRPRPPQQRARWRMSLRTLVPRSALRRQLPALRPQGDCFGPTGGSRGVEPSSPSLSPAITHRVERCRFVAAIHLYHGLAFKLSAADIFHHLVFALVGCGSVMLARPASTSACSAPMQFAGTR